MHIETVHLVNFRCFSSLNLEFKSPIVLVYGPNGSGKTTILEALHYACYLRSFKAHLHKHIIGPLAEGFSIDLGIIGPHGFDTLHVGLKRNKKSVQLNGQPVRSYEELYRVYKVVTIKEDDIAMIQGSPSLRRSFIDYMVLLFDPGFAALGKKYKVILDNRNALLIAPRNDTESYMLWTEQLLTISAEIQKKRLDALAWLTKEVKIIYATLFPGLLEGISFTYEYAKSYPDAAHLQSAEELLGRYPSLVARERAQKRTLFGAHLDDLLIEFQQKSSKIYASRGQQKLIVILLKLAQVAFMKKRNEEVIVLIDDFMADFDEAKMEILIPLLATLPSQLVITSPIKELIQEKFKAYDVQQIDLTDRSNACLTYPHQD
ncbi:DNA replication/repair protein RecF [Candidatus Dependentiae bacterium]|nr:DNA replication/repair protein RecF [Candidatus Dependentiae bacterium]